MDFQQLMAKLGRNGQVLAGGGILAFIASFLPWYSSSYSFGGTSLGGTTIPGRSYSNSWSAWQFVGAWFPLLLLVAVGALVVLAALGTVNLPAITVALVATAASVLAVVIIVLRWLTFPSASSGDAFASGSAGAGWGLYVGLVIALAMAVFGWLSYTAEGGSVNTIGDAFKAKSVSPPPPPM